MIFFLLHPGRGPFGFLFKAVFHREMKVLAYHEGLFIGTYEQEVGLGSGPGRSLASGYFVDTLNACHGRARSCASVGYK